MNPSIDNSICKENIYVSFFESNAKKLRNFLIYKFGNEFEAEDIVQDTFIKLWQNCKDVPLEKAKSYIYTLANNATLNNINHQKVVLKYQNSSVKDAKSFENPEYLLEEDEFKTKLLSVIEKINETQRVAFLMNRIDGKKYAEIAEELNISVKAVEKRIHIALVEIRKEFKNFK